MQIADVPKFILVLYEESFILLYDDLLIYTWVIYKFISTTMVIIDFSLSVASS